MNSRGYLGTSALIDFGVDLCRSIIYVNSNYLDRSKFIYIPLLVVAAWVGSYLGKYLLQKIEQQQFRKITLALFFVTGVTLVTQRVVLLFL